MKNYDIARIHLDMIAYFHRDYRRIAHAQKVHSYTRLIADLAGMEEGRKKRLEAAAILHDIGIPEAMRIHGSSAPRFQEAEGAGVCAEILDGYTIPEEDRLWITAAVGAHHSYEKVEELGFRILFEADYLVNIMEKNTDDSPENVREIRKKYIVTPAALEVFDLLFPDPAVSNSKFG